jgi:transcriptional regulator with XRE-family HTH domain
MSRYLDDARESGLVKSDYDLAKKLGIGRAAVSKWRLGDHAPGEDQAAALATLLGKPEIMAEASAARAKTPEARKAWEKVAALLHEAKDFAIVAAIGLACAMPATQADARVMTQEASKRNTNYGSFKNEIKTTQYQDHPIYRYMCKYPFNHI